MAYPIPHWIPGPQDVAGQFMTGLREGAAITQEQARLAQEANLTQMQAMLRQQEAERQNALEQQRLAQTQAYQQAEIGLRKQELQQAQQLNQVKIQESARLFQASQAFHQWMADNPDKDPAEGILKFFPGTGDFPTGAGTLARSLFESRQKLGPPTVEEIEGHKYLRIPERGGNYRMQEMREGTNRLVPMKIRALQTQAATLQKQIDAEASLYEGRDVSTMSEGQKRAYEAYQAKKKHLDAINDQIDQMYATGELDLGGGGAPGGGAEQPAIRTWNPQTQSWEGGASPTIKQSDIPPAPLFSPRAGELPGLNLPGQVPRQTGFTPRMPSLPATIGAAGQMGQSMLPAYGAVLQGGRNLLNVPQTLQTMKPIVPFIGRGFQNLVNPFLQQQPPIPPQLQIQTEEQQQ